MHSDILLSEQKDKIRPIAIVNYDFRASGTVAKSIEIAKAAVDAGLPVELWVAQAVGPLLARVPHDLPVYAFSKPTAINFGRGVTLALSLASLVTAINRRKPAVLLSGGNHFHLTARLATSMVPRRIRPRYGIRVSNSSLKPNRQRQSRLTKMRWADRFKLRGADFVVTVADALASEVSMALPSISVTSVPNGVDLNRISMLSAESFDHPFLKDRKRGTTGPVLVSMGRISFQKGFDILLQAIALIPQALDVRLLIIGGGSNKHVRKLHELASQLGISSRVGFLGYRDNPFSVMSRADLFVSASRWEGASNALIEALACGLPVVATDCPTGNREILEKVSGGTLARPNDPHSLADAICAELALNGPQKRQPPNMKAFDIAVCLESWIDLLRKNYGIVVCD